MDAESDTTKKERRAPVWQYFVFSNDKKKVICNLCRVSLTYCGGTTNMNNHISFKHKSVSLNHAPNITKDKKVQKTMTDFQKKPSQVFVCDQEFINRKLALMCARDLRPLSIVNGAGFKEFVNALNPSYKIPSHPTVKKYVNLIYEEEKTKLIDEINGKTVALTSDLWTSVAMQGYISLTAHFLDDNWTLTKRLLAVRLVNERHTGVIIAKYLTELKNEFHIQDVSAICTDNAANMNVAAREAGVFDTKCFAHTIQLAITDGLKLQQMSKTLAAARRLVTFFNHSLVAHNALKKHQIGTPLSLIQDTPTRWNSSFNMMDRLLKLRLSVYSVLLDDNILKPSERSKLEIQDSFWTIMEDSVKVLAPFADVTELLGKEDMPTCSSVYFLLNKLITFDLSLTDDDSGIIKSLKDTIRGGIEKRFKISGGIPTELNSPLLRATALDPRYKSLKFLPADSRDTVYCSLKDSIAPSTEIVQVKVEKDDVHPVQKKRVLDYLLGDVVDLTENNPDDDVASVEIQSYLSAPVTAADCRDPLKWWQRNEGNFPHLAKLAKRYLAIPATSISSERVFSAAGLTLTKLRSTIDPENAEKLIFLHQNLETSVKNAEEASASIQFIATFPNPPVIEPEHKIAANDPPLPSLDMSDDDNMELVPSLTGTRNIASMMDA